MQPLRRPVLLLLLLLLPVAPCEAGEGGSTAAPAAPAAKTAAPAITGRFETVGDQRVLTLWGTPRERGFAQGYLLAEPIVAGVEHDFQRIMDARFKQLYETLLTKMVVPRFQFAPRELEELEGLMAGLEARLPPERRTIAALGRPFALVDLKALNTFGDWYGLGCSSLAVWGDLTHDGRMLVGRNFDFPAFDLVLEHQYVVVRAADGERAGQVGVSYPGCIGTLTGMNAAGVFVAIHDVRVKPTLDKALRPNVPRLLAVRRLLEQTAGAEACTQARDLARSWPTLYGNNLMVVAPKRAKGVPCAAVLEYDCRADVDGGCTMRVADRAAELDGESPEVCLTCTNHHRVREEPKGYLEPFPRWRYELLSPLEAKARPAAPLDVDGVFARMVTASYPRGGKAQGRAAGMGAELSRHGTLHQVVAEPEALRLHVRLGRVGRHIGQAPVSVYEIPTLLAGTGTPATTK